MEKLEMLISREEIEKRLTEIAKQLEKDYENEKVIFVGILKGSFVFLADIIRKVKIPIEIDFMTASSYGNETVSSGSVKIVKDIDINVKNKHILLVEDIVDTGYTLDYVKKFLDSKGAKSVKCLALLDKPERRKVDIDVEYIGFTIPDKFIVGYGIDYAQKYRNLDHIAAVTLI